MQELPRQSVQLSAIYELTPAEAQVVAGGAGEVQIDSSPVQGGQSWVATCGPGYSISTSLSTNNNDLSEWSNPSNFSCVAGESGAQSFTWLSQGAYAYSFYEDTYNGS